MSRPTAGPPLDGPRVVALGGGHGLAASLQALRRVTPHLTAVVTVADDGGSSGRLRQELGILPPGDLRMALAALSGEGEDCRTWEALLQHRFDGDGPLAGHAVGNLVLAGLVASTGDQVEALDVAGRMLGAVDFLDRYEGLLRLVFGGYEREGKSYALVAVGCTGGKHRSVAMVEQLAGRLAGEGVDVQVVHRDLGRE